MPQNEQKKKRLRLCSKTTDSRTKEQTCLEQKEKKVGNNFFPGKKLFSCFTVKQKTEHLLTCLCLLLSLCFCLGRLSAEDISSNKSELELLRFRVAMWIDFRALLMRSEDSIEEKKRNQTKNIS